jgi:hypothetical protein
MGILVISIDFGVGHAQPGHPRLRHWLHQFQYIHTLFSSLTSVSGALVSIFLYSITFIFQIITNDAVFGFHVSVSAL